MPKVVPKRELLEGPLGAAHIGLTAVAGLDAEELQEAIEGIVTLLGSRVSGIMDAGGPPLPARSNINIEGSATVVDNPADDAVDIIIRGLTAPLTWTNGTPYFSYQIVEYFGSSFVVVNDHVASSGSPPAMNNSNPNYALFAAKGDTGAGPGGVHGSTHTENSTDPIPNATDVEGGLLSAEDKARLDSIEPEHDHDQYALADGTRLTLATSVTSPGLHQPRLNGSVLEQWDGDSWEPLSANLRPGATVPKSQLADLDIDNGDLAINRSLQVHCTSLTRPTTGVMEGQVIYETDTELYYKNVSENPDAPEWLPLVPALTGVAASWTLQTGAGAVFSNMGNGDPVAANLLMSRSMAVGPYDSQIGTTTARCVKFRLPRTLNLSKVWYMGWVAVAPLYKFCIYHASSLVKVWESGLFGISATTPANPFQSLSASGATLNIEEDYWFCFASNLGFAASVFWLTPQAPLSPLQFASGASPLRGKNLGIAEYGQIAIGSSASFPTSLPTVSNPAYAGQAYGTLPLCFLEGTAA